MNEQEEAEAEPEAAEKLSPTGDAVPLIVTENVDANEDASPTEGLLVKLPIYTQVLNN